MPILHSIVWLLGALGFSILTFNAISLMNEQAWDQFPLISGVKLSCE
jgi:hypothetical protein